MKCHEKTEVYSRVVGYFRPTQAWNKGKREEFNDRVMFAVGGDDGWSGKSSIAVQSVEESSILEATLTNPKTVQDA